MPQSKAEKRLKALEKLEAEYKTELDTDEYAYLGYRATMLGGQIQNLRRKLNISLISPLENAN